MIEPEDIEEATDLDNDQSIEADVEEDEPLFDESTPLRERKLQTNPFDFIVSSISSQIDDESIVLQDKYQRRRVWNDIKGARLIESLVLNVPIPVCYFAEIDDGAYAVVDGQQRLTAIYRFINNQFPLRGLKVRPDLNKKRFHELPPADQRVIKSRTIRCIVILKESHPDIRFDVFERLNTATVSLNRQELRNSNYRGALNTLIIDLCDNPDLLSIRNSRTPDKRMKDAELILRFFAFHFGGHLYRNRFTSHLDTYLDIGKSFPSDEIERHKVVFEQTIRLVHDIFGPIAFRRASEGGGFESQINSAIFDAIMLSMARLDPAEAIANAQEIRDAYVEIGTRNADFIDAISRATRDKARLNTRLEQWTSALRGQGITCPAIRFG